MDEGVLGPFTGRASIECTRVHFRQSPDALLQQKVRFGSQNADKQKARREGGLLSDHHEWVFCDNPSASMPGGDLLFQRLIVSTIGADWFHGRVREGIGWFTDAMATRQWSRRIGSMLCVYLLGVSICWDGLSDVVMLAGIVRHRWTGPVWAGLSLMAGFSSMNRVIRTG